MKKWNDRKIGMAVILAGLCFMVMSCGEKDLQETEKSVDTEISAKEETEDVNILFSESAEDAYIDFEALQAENEDVFGWLYVPGTGIDAPVLQSAEADDYYESRNVLKEIDEDGALYTELANLKNMCDFNTVIHGRKTGDFTDLYEFADPDFFENHERAYIYIEGNVLTYEIFAAFEREDTSLIRTYNFTYASGCEEFLEEVYQKQMGKNIREGWEGITPYHFLITLTTKETTGSGRQFVVLAALVGDAAGTINRIVE